MADPANEKSIDSFGILIGVCPVCGGTGDYYGHINDASDTPLDTGRGYDLTTYKGQVMCNKCKKWLKAKDENRPMTDWWIRENEFRHKVGFTNRVI